MKPRKAKTLGPIHANVGVEVAYRKKLERLVEEMNDSLIYWLSAAYRANPPVALDASPVTEMVRTFKNLGKRWQKRFDDAAPKFAEYFATQASERVSGRLEQLLDEAGLTVNFKLSPAVRAAYEASVAENVGLIKSIASEHLTDVQGILMRSVSQGRDLHLMAKELEEKGWSTKARAALIARDQNNKTTAVITRARQVEAGITTAKWMHSTAGKKPRPSHVAFAAGRLGGPVYDIASGALIEGKRIWPGTEINCRCFCCPIIPGVYEP